MDFPDHVLFNVNVAVVAMVFRKKYGQEFERADSTTNISSASNVSYTSNSSTRSIVTSDEMWTASEKLYNTLIQCLETEDSVLNFINWFLDGVRKTFESENSFAFLKQQILVFPDTCFLCKKPYTSPQDKWCNECESHVFESKFHTWTSGNVDLDRFIRETQREAKNSTEFLRWIPFSSFTELNQIGKGGFSEVYSGNYTQDRLNGTLKQWVTNMECMIILDYLQCHSEESIKDISLEKWDEILKEFASRMRRIYENRKVLKCRSLGQSKEHSEVQVKRKSSISSITRIKNLLKKRPSLKKNKTRSSKLNPSTTTNSLIRINQIPVTVSPLQNKFIQKTVALKRLVDSQDLSLNFINKMKTQYLASKKSSKFSRMYGLTQDPQTKDYFIVLQYANDHDLHKYMNQNSVSIDWYQRISLLHGIVRGIFELHKANLIHHNLHTGNILLRHNTRKEKTGRFSTSTVRTWISDSGLWGPAGSSSSGIDTSGATSMGGNSNLNSTIMGPSKEPKISPAQSMINLQKGKLYGILPYIAPEVLQGKQYTQSSDIYSLGIIMWELSNNATLGKHNLHSQPFHDQPHDINLATEIVNGKRPNIDDVASGNIPECWLNLMKKCWASKPEDRPNIEDIKKITSAWNMERSKNSLVFSFSRSGDDDDVVGQFLDAEKRRVERLNKGKQVESYNKLEEEESGNELKETVTERLNQDDNNYDSMKSRLLDFLVEAPSPNNHKDLEIIYENIDSTKKEKVDSGYQQPIMEEHEDEVKHEVELENPIEKDRDSNRNFQEKSYVNEQKQILLGVKQDNQDSPIKNGIEANSEIGSKEISLTKEKEP